MAGGLGTRLRPLTEDVPKPMLRVAGRPILERIVLHLVGFGIEHISISVGYLAEVIEAHFGDGERVRRARSTTCARTSRWARPARSACCRRRRPRRCSS